MSKSARKQIEEIEMRIKRDNPDHSWKVLAIALAVSSLASFIVLNENRCTAVIGNESICAYYQSIVNFLKK